VGKLRVRLSLSGEDDLSDGWKRLSVSKAEDLRELASKTWDSETIAVSRAELLPLRMLRELVEELAFLKSRRFGSWRGGSIVHVGVLDDVPGVSESFSFVSDLEADVESETKSGQR